jgi:F0F1-type ATP synthase assembly protein I
VDDPGDRERRDEGKGLSGLAEAYRKAGPFLAASTNLVVAVGVFTWLGIWADRKIGWKVPWLTMAGALLGMTGGMISFLRTALGNRKKK